MIISPLIPYLEKIWPAVSGLGAGIIKKKLFFHEICRDAGIEIHQDDFDFTYLQSLSIYLLDVEHQWGEIFPLTDVRKAFQVGYAANDMTEVRQLLDYHLHTTIKKGPLKKLDSVPDTLLDDFIIVYRDQAAENLSPSTMEVLRSTSQITDTVDDNRNLLLEVRESIKNLQPPSLDNYVLKGEVEQWLDSEHQAQLDQIKKAFDTYQFETAKKNLLEFKDRIWPRTTDNIRFKVLNNIGYAFMLLNDVDGALPFYEEAASVNPDHTANLSNLAGLYLIKKWYGNAEPIAEKLHASHPWIKLSLQLYQLPEDELPEDLEDLVPQEMREVPEVLIALINISNNKMPEAALSYAHRLYKQKPDSDNFIDIYTNIVCNTVIGDYVGFQTRELLSEKDKNHLRLAKDLLEPQWKKLRNTDQRGLQIALLEKLTLLQTVLSEQDDALKLADQLIEIDPGNYFATKIAGVNLLLMQRFAEAADRFAQIGADHPQLYEFCNSWMLALGNTDRMDEAKRIGELFVNKPDTDAEGRQQTFNILAFLYERNGQYEEALIYIEEAERLNSLGLGIQADKAKILRALKRNQDAKKTEQQMKMLIDKHLAEQSVRDRYFAATYFMQYDQPKQAAGLYETMTQPHRNHFLTYQLIDAWTRSGQKARALPVCIDLRERFGPNPEYTIKEVEIYFHYRDYVQAEKILTEFVKHFPDDLSAQLNLAGLFHRNKNYEALTAFCLADLSRFTFRADQLWGYVELLRSAGQYARCLKLLYEHRRANPSFESNKMFISYCLNDPNDREHVVMPETVREDTAVTLVSDGLSACYIVLDRPVSELRRNDAEINLQDPIFRKLDGKKVGDRVSLRKDQDERWQISKILPLYMHVFQEAMRQNTTIYAAQSGMISGDIRELADIEKFLDRQLAVRREFDQAMAQQEKNYAAYSLPLSTFASLNKTSSINIYEYFSRTCGIRCAIGTVSQYDAAVQTARDASRFVPEITALLTLFKIGFKRPEDMLKFAIPHTTADMIYNYVGEKELNANSEHMTFGEHQGQKFRQRVTVADKQKELEYLQAFQSWVNQNCEPMPCKALLEYDSKKWREFKNAIGIDVFECALLSLELGGIFLSDDAATRDVFGDELHTKGIWIQALIRSLVVNNIISPGDGYDYYVKLIKLGHRHTTVDKDMVIYFLQKSNFKLDQSVTATVDILSGSYSDENSIQIVFSIIAALVELAPTPRRFEDLCYYLLMRCISGRTVPSSTRLYRLSDYYVSNANASLVVKHAIWQLFTDHRMPLTIKKIH